MNLELNLLYVHSESIGYGRYGVYLSDALASLGVDVFDHLPGPDETAEQTYEHLNQGHRAGRSNTVAWVSVPSHARGWYKGQFPVISTMWEATRLPESFRENMYSFERVIVPSMQNVELFSQYHKDVRFVPLGVDPARWNYIPRRSPDTHFQFLIGGSGKRKGTDLARKAFRAAFPQERFDGPTPMLVMKSPKGRDEEPGPNIQVVAGRLTAEDETALYAASHCYLQPSRGEGFGLQPLQAMAQGMPTILTNAHGHASFAHLAIPLDWGWSKSDYFIYGDAGDWWEPSLDDLVDKMRWVYNNYDEAALWAARGAEIIAEEWTWKQTAEKFVEAIGVENLGPYEGSGGWHVPEMAKFLVVLTRDWTADIGGISYQFKAGQEYWEPADVKRILFEAGLLDARCLDINLGGTSADLGLLDVQLEHLGDYTAAKAHCDTCGQRLGSGVTKADEIFAELNAA